jgi:hypothetical protein
MLVAMTSNIVITIKYCERSTSPRIGIATMKINFALSLIVLAFLPACTATKTVSKTADETTRYANYAADQEPAPPAEGPRDVNTNPAYIPTPLLRASAAGAL